MSGLFGGYGGRYVPETLIPALDELAGAWAAAKADECLLGRGRRGSAAPTPGGRRRSPSPSVSPRKLLYLKREDLLHTGRAQLNNALGQAVLAGRLGKRLRRRDRRGPARGRRRDGLRALRARVRRLHGLRGHAPPTPQRRAHGAARRRGPPGRVRHPHAEGGDERGDPRLDHERGDDALPDRLVRRPCPLPRDRPRAAGRDRPRGTRAAARGRGRLPDVVLASVGGGSNAIGIFAGFLDDDVELSASRRPVRHARQRASRRPARGAILRLGRRGRPGDRRALDLGRSRLPRRRARAYLAARQRPPRYVTATDEEALRSSGG